MQPDAAGQGASGIAWAFVTPSYAGDYERCLLLCRSMDEFLSGNWHHYVIVDKPHYEMFKHLESERRSVWLTDDVTPVKMRLVFTLPFLGGRSVWWSSETGLSIGWHMQQMVKIGMAHRVDCDGLTYVDSDVFFLRPYHTDQMVRDGRVRFFRSGAAHEIGQTYNPKLVKSGLDMLGLPHTGTFHGYIDNFVTWHRKEVLALCAHLASRNGGKWYRAFRHRIQLSEYMLYGLYADLVDMEKARLFIDNLHICKTIWGGTKPDDKEIAAFCQKLEPYQVTVGMQSFLGVSVALLEEQFEWAKARYGRNASTASLARGRA